MKIILKFKRNYLLACIGICIICGFLILRSRLYSVSNFVKVLSSETSDEDDEIPQLKENENEIPVCIVDQHQEVIPYWYKAVGEGIIKASGNTLIHIDGHSDMAPPENDFKNLSQFHYRKHALTHQFLPLMQSNDDFIVSAIFKGLISQMIWVYPSWMHDINTIEFTKSFVGVTKHMKTKENTVCICQQPISKKRKKHKSEIDCRYLNREAEDENDLMPNIKPKDCKKVNDFQYITVVADKFIEYINLKKVKNLFVDIDEDYFGVDSGVQNFIDEGLSIETINQIDQMLTSIFCPDTVNAEEKLSKLLRRAFALIGDFHTLSVTKRFHKIQKILHDETGDYFCKEKGNIDNDIALAINTLSSVDTEQMAVLSKVKYCSTYSPRMRVYESKFELCHGLTLPETPASELHVGDEKEIRKRGQELTNIIDFMYKYTEPRFFTISRSLRDGYTPRHQQILIESVILNSLDTEIRKHGKVKRVIYDKQLVFGKDGWK